MLLSLSMIIGELGIDLNEFEIRAMYYIKRNKLYVVRTYVFANSSRGLILNLLVNRSKWKNKY